MSTKRTPIGRPPHPQITPAAMKAFLLVEEIRDAGQDEEWEEEGGRRRECLDAENVVDSELKLQPWETGPYDVDETARPTRWTKASAHEIDRWNKAVVLRRAIIAANKAANKAA